MTGAIIGWSLAGLYLVWLILSKTVLRNQTKQIADTVGLAIFRSVDWVRVHILRRESWRNPPVDALRTAVIMTSFFETSDIRYIVEPQADGSIVYKIHKDDVPKLQLAMEALEAHFGPFDVVGGVPPTPAP